MDWLIPAAFALDLLLGDPPMPHPVMLVGAVINRLEILFASFFDNRRLAGALLAALTLLVTGGLAWALLRLAAEIHPLAALIVGIWLAYTTLALRALHRESREVVRCLEGKRPAEARRALALIVGRETATLDEEGILRACIETVAENTSSGVVAPLFYLAVGGPVLALLYKAAGTLDSMVGYRDDGYRELGWASARLDDLFNLLPARLTGMLMVLAAPLAGLRIRGAWRIMLRDARRHASPNAGFPEAAMAGALGVRLGGAAVYFGIRVEKATLGDDAHPVSVADYHAAVRLMYLTSLLALGLAVWLVAAAG
ncbi:adenosylcobinamide-phosphate synthase CbiB [Trichloromonas sp.]|uniref:adenosylcobinamide-phosphate synthase CbiB n=1 Tax=Trichloromonas sp. TaxID=3069249 RepID=UPI002A3D3348|nr:adenosylcobinamide-phosphate synthase CbiB [Trichloromonas sp.]